MSSASVQVVIGGVLSGTLPAAANRAKQVLGEVGSAMERLNQRVAVLDKGRTALSDQAASVERLRNGVKVWAEKVDLAAQKSKTLAREVKAARGELAKLVDQRERLAKSSADGKIRVQQIQQEIQSSGKDPTKQQNQQLREAQREAARADKALARMTAQIERQNERIAQQKARVQESVSAWHNANREMGRAQSTAQAAADAWKRASAAARGTANEQARIGRTLDVLRTKYQALQTAQARVQANQDHRRDLRGQALETVGLAASIWKTVTANMDFEYALMRSANTASIYSAPAVAALGAEFTALVGPTNQSRAALAEAFQTMVGLGKSSGSARALLRDVGRTATATGADIKEMSQLAFSATELLKIPESQAGRIFDITHTGGKLGGAELKDMAKDFPALISAGAPLGLTGLEGLASLTALAQVFRRGAPNAEVAMNNLLNVLQKLTTAETKKKFAKQGIDIERAFLNAKDRGENPIESLLELIRQKSGLGTRDDAAFRLAELFEDKQVLEGLRTFTDIGSKEYRRIRRAALESVGVVDRDFNSALATTKERLKLAGEQGKIAFGKIGVAMKPLLDTVIDLSGRAAEWMGGMAERHPRLTALIVGTTGALIGLKAAALGFSYARALIVAPFLLLEERLAATAAKAALTRAALEGVATADTAAATTSVRARLAAMGANALDAASASRLPGVARAAGPFRFSGAEGPGNLLDGLDGKSRAARAGLAGKWKGFAMGGISTLPIFGLFARTGTAAETAATGLGRVGSAFARVSGVFRSAVGPLLRTIGIFGRLATFGAILTPQGALIAGVAITIYKFWQPLSVFLSGVWDGFVEATKPLEPLLRPVVTVFDAVTVAVGDAAKWIWDLVTPVSLSSQELKGLHDTGKALGESIGKNLVPPVEYLVQTFKDLAGILKIVDLGLTKIPGYEWMKGKASSGLNEAASRSDRNYLESRALAIFRQNLPGAPSSEDKLAFLKNASPLRIRTADEQSMKERVDAAKKADDEYKRELAAWQKDEDDRLRAIYLGGPAPKKKYRPKPTPPVAAAPPGTHYNDVDQSRLMDGASMPPSGKGKGRQAAHPLTGRMPHLSLNSGAARAVSGSPFSRRSLAERETPPPPALPSSAMPKWTLPAEQAAVIPAGEATPRTAFVMGGAASPAPSPQTARSVVATESPAARFAPEADPIFRDMLSRLTEIRDGVKSWAVRARPVPLSLALAGAAAATQPAPPALAVRPALPASAGPAFAMRHPGAAVTTAAETTTLGAGLSEFRVHPTAPQSNVTIAPQFQITLAGVNRGDPDEKKIQRLCQKFSEELQKAMYGDRRSAMHD